MNGKIDVKSQRWQQFRNRESIVLSISNYNTITADDPIPLKELLLNSDPNPSLSAPRTRQKKMIFIVIKANWFCTVQSCKVVYAFQWNACHLRALLRNNYIIQTSCNIIYSWIEGDACFKKLPFVFQKVPFLPHLVHLNRCDAAAKTTHNVWFGSVLESVFPIRAPMPPQHGPVLQTKIAVLVKLLAPGA